MDGLEIEVEVDGKKKIECFDNYEYWMAEENGEERFITRIKENDANAKKSADSKEESGKSKIVEIKKFENKEVK